MAELSRFFGLSFSALLPLVNPLGSALVLLGLVGEANPAVYRMLAKKIAISSALFLIAIEAVGTALLNFFGISLPVMQVSGGLVIAAMGWSLLNQGETTPSQEKTEVDSRTLLGSLEQKIFYPFTFPITTGPGCVVVMITLSAHASARSLLANVTAHVGIALAAVLLCASVYFCYRYAPAIAARVPPKTAVGILRVIAFFLLCIGVQITWNGVETMLKIVVKS